MKLGFLQIVASRWPILIAAVFSAYSVLLLTNVSNTQSQLRAEKDLRIVADSKRRAAAVADLIIERRNITVELAESSEINNYFVNKSLGMSLRYGLNANLFAIEERFRRQMERTNLRGEQIFNRIIFFDQTGQKLVDLSATNSELPELPANYVGVWPLIDLKSQQILIHAPVLYKGEENGYVVTMGDLRQISRDLIKADATGNYGEFLLTNAGQELPAFGSQVHFDALAAEKLSKLPEDILTPLDASFNNGIYGDHLAVRSSIPEAGLSLMTVLGQEAAYGQVSSRFFLYSAGAFPIILLIAAILFDRVRRVGEALAQSEQRFHTIFDNVRDVIFVLDIANNTIVEANPRVSSLYGYGQQDIVGLTMADISDNWETESHRLWMEYVTAALSGKPQLFAWRARRQNGEFFWVEISLLRAIICGDERLLVVAHDITQRKAQEQELIQALEDQRNLNKRLEEAQLQLIQSEKMASIGQLAAGVAHEINNPIGFVTSNLGALDNYVESFLNMLESYRQEENSLPTDKQQALAQLRKKFDIDYLSRDVNSLLEESREGLQRVSRIVADLKDFSHVAESDFQNANLEKGLDSTLNVVWNELKYKARIIKEYAGIPEIECLPSQLNQVFMNLFVNAAQSIAEQGVITVRTAFDEQDVWVEIEDTGSGISQEHLSRIFEPFFTTKPVGKGTGLGLSLAYGIIKKHGGNIEVSSEQQVGSKFRITLPRKNPNIQHPSPPDILGTAVSKQR